MQRLPLTISAMCVVLGSVSAAQRPAEIIRTEIVQAEKDVPKMAHVLELQPGMTVADVGAGGGAMAMVMARWLGSTGGVYATDINTGELRALVVRERLPNLTVLEGSARSTSLPARCCDAVFMRDVYHHLTHPNEINKSLLAALKPGGRLAIIDFEPAPGSRLPEGVSQDRGGHGIHPPLVVSEVSASGLQHVRTIVAWPPDDDAQDYFLVLFRKP